MYNVGPVTCTPHSPFDSATLLSPISSMSSLLQNSGARTTIISTAVALSALAFAIYSLVLASHSGTASYFLQLISDTPPEWGAVILLLLFMIVSLPLAWGYLVLNVGAGYLYGFWTGLGIVVTGGALGAWFSTYVCHYICNHWIEQKVNSTESLRAVRRVMSTGQAYRLVLLTRLTPIPFGLQNALFSLTPLDQPKYIAYSAAGLFPTQLLNTYVGSTLNNMEDVLVGRNMDLQGYMTYAVQCAAGILLTVAVFYKARTELHHATRTLSEPSIQLV